MNTEEAYNQIVEWFSRPDAVFGTLTPLLFLPIVCVYRGDFDSKSNIRCAAGCLIPDDLYLPEMETKTVTWLLHRWPTLFDQASVGFLTEAQRLHDGYAEKKAEPSEFVAALKELWESRYV